MEQNSLRLKVVRLAQRSRRAIRLYTSVYNSASATNNNTSSARPSSSSSVSLHSPASVYGSNVYGSSSLGGHLNETSQVSSNDLSDLDSESYSLGSASMAALSTKGSSSRSLRNAGERFSEMQAVEWRDVNMSLLRALTSALEETRQRELPRRILNIRDTFGEQWLTLKMLVQKNRAEAISAAERADFINLAILSEGLVSFKARYQASEAAYHEISEICKGISGSLANVSELRSTTPATNHYLNGRPDQQHLFKVLGSQVLGPSTADNGINQTASLQERRIRDLSRDKFERFEIANPVEGGPGEIKDTNHLHQAASGKISLGNAIPERETSDQATEDKQKVIMLKMAYS